MPSADTTKRRNNSVRFVADSRGSSAGSRGTSSESDHARARASGAGGTIADVNDDDDDGGGGGGGDEDNDGLKVESENGSDTDEDDEFEEEDDAYDALELKKVASIGRRHTPHIPSLLLRASDLGGHHMPIHGRMFHLTR